MNLFQSVIDAGNQGRTDMQGHFDRAARTRAGQAMARGDQGEAARTLYSSGQLDAGAAIEESGVQAEQRQYERGRTEKSGEVAEASRRADALVKVATSLQGVPLEQRHQMLQQIAPAFEGIGIDPAPFLSLTPDQLTDEALQMFSGEVKNQITVLNTRRGIVAVDERALAKDMTDESAARVLYEDPYADEEAEAKIDATRARAESSRASAARARRPPAARGGGGGGVGSKPWERTW